MTSHHPLQGLCHHVHVAPQKYGSLFRHLWSWIKNPSFSSFLIILTALFQVSWTHGLVCSHFTFNGKFCSMVCQQMGYLWPIQGNQQLIYFTLFHHVYDLIDGQLPRVTGTCNPKIVKTTTITVIWSSFVASHPYYLNLYDNIAQGASK